MDLRELASDHRGMSAVLAKWQPGQILLWYADLDVRVSNDTVSYRCPHCGSKTAMRVEEFIHQDTNLDLYCSECRGELSDRGGPG
ncbi:MAG: hypothetical protein HY330_07225 [Chloroflexi bacterium]|nr:hypothetical protein [Chloroflexota bacterium]